MKLELKHIAPYLPYGLMAVVDKEHEVKIVSLCAKVISRSYNPIVFENKHGNVGNRDYKDIQIILRPLFDLTKEIEHNGEKFIPLKKLWSIHSKNGDFIGKIGNKHKDYKYCLYYDDDDVFYKFIFSNNAFYEVVTWRTDSTRIANQIKLFEKLFEYHFDVFGLIDAGLAIDINTLKQ